ncbi:LacI family DNA-binding transcriptional regulator [Aestuariimicrobium soli]|uniref:LacI family DNA-binding transcriptional regulator n=1 Tax=Aestuariimicrobium soli TaxID=2035834 RepID=UPI003EB9D8C6
MSDEALDPMGRMSRRPTIYDVAAAAGVNPSTVSRAFSRPGRVSDKTAAHIHAVAQAMGYRTEAVFRAPSNRSTQLLALAVADVTNPFFFSIIRGAEAEATARGYQLLLADTQESQSREQALFDRSLTQVDGLLVASSRISDTGLRAAARKVPTVVMNRVVTGLPSVVADNARAMRRALEHLASLGHRRVVYVSGPEASWANGSRYRAFREGCFELDLIDQRVGPVSPTVKGGYGITDTLRDSGATAAVCYNDLTAIGVIRRAKDLGWSVPGDLSVIGFDNTFASDLVSPSLTTVAAPLNQLAQRATSLLITMIQRNTNPGPEPQTLPIQLIVRESTAEPG